MSIEPDAVSIKVVARFRPFNEKELAINASSTFKFIGDECVNINVCDIYIFYVTLHSYTPIYRPPIYCVVILFPVYKPYV